MARRNFQEVAAIPGTDRSLPVPVPRGARLPGFVGLTADPGPILDALDVTVVGAGGVGRNLALGLARQQVGTLRIVDRGRYKRESLLTQPIGPADVGEPKAGNTGRLSKQLSPGTRVLVLDGPAEALDRSELIDTDLVLLATDNLAAEVEVGQRCVHLRKPLVQASVHGDTLVAQVRFFSNRQGDGACPACGFGTDEWAYLNQETTFSCEGSATDHAAGTVTAPPTMSTGFLCALAADLALVQVFRQVLGLGPALGDSVLEYCGYSNRTVTTLLARDPDCPCDHRAWEVLPAPRPLADCTLRELLDTSRLRADDGPAGVAFGIDDLAFLERGTCRCCGDVPLQRFAAEGTADLRCPGCGGPARAQAFFTHRLVPASLLQHCSDRPLREMGAASPRSVLVRGRERAVLFAATPLRGERP